jgi:hypothetical protein
MKFVKIDTPVPTPTTAAKPHHSHAADHGGYMYLDDMLDKTFLTDYFLQ